MANTGGGKGGKGAGGERSTDTLNFTYSAAVEAALEQLEKEIEEEAVVPTPRKKKAKKATPSKEVNEDGKPKQKIEINKLGEIYTDWCQIKELNTPRTSRSQQAPPTGRGGQPTHREGEGHDGVMKTEDHQQTERAEKRDEKAERREDKKDKKEDKGSPEERRKRERDKEDDAGNKTISGKGT